MGNTQWPPGQTPGAYFSNRGTRSSSERKTAINLRVEPQLLADLAEVGNDEGLNLSDTCRLLMREAIAARKVKPKKKGK
jgi:hypothetical protein